MKTTEKKTERTAAQLTAAQLIADKMGVNMSYTAALQNLIAKAEREHNKAEADKLRHLLELAQERGNK